MATLGALSSTPQCDPALSQTRPGDGIDRKAWIRSRQRGMVSSRLYELRYFRYTEALMDLSGAEHGAKRILVWEPHFETIRHTTEGDRWA